MKKFIFLFILFLIPIIPQSSIQISQGSTFNPERLTTNSEQDFFASWYPDSDKILYSSKLNGEWLIKIMNSDGTNQNEIKTFSGMNICPTIDPKKEKVVFISDTSTVGNPGILKLFIMNVDGSNITKIVSWLSNVPGNVDITPPNPINRPTWSPDGKKIAFSAYREDDISFSIWIYSLDGGLIRLTNKVAGEWCQYPQWSPDGSTIAYTVNIVGTDNYEIRLIDVFTRKVTTLISASDIIAQPTWNPDGSKISFISKDSGQTELWCIDVNGNNNLPYTNDGYEKWYPSWSPDGTQIIFGENRNNNWDIYSITPQKYEISKITYPEKLFIDRDYNLSVEVKNLVKYSANLTLKISSNYLSLDRSIVFMNLLPLQTSTFLFKIIPKKIGVIVVSVKLLKDSQSLDTKNVTITIKPLANVELNLPNTYLLNKGDSLNGEVQVKNLSSDIVNNVNITVSPNLKDFFKLENNIVSTINPNETTKVSFHISIPSSGINYGSYLGNISISGLNIINKNYKINLTVPLLKLTLKYDIPKIIKLSKGGNVHYSISVINDNLLDFKEIEFRKDETLNNLVYFDKQFYKLVESGKGITESLNIIIPAQGIDYGPYNGKIRIFGSNTEISEISLSIEIVQPTWYERFIETLFDPRILVAYSTLISLSFGVFGFFLGKRKKENGVV